MPRPNLYDILKVLALISMVLDHVGYFLFPELFRLRRVGRIAFPIFLFLVGYNHSYRRRRSLWGWGLVVQGVLVWSMMQGMGEYGSFKGEVWLNILLAIALTRVLLGGARRIQGGVLVLFVLGVIFLPYSYDIIEYGTMNLIWACVGYRVRVISARSEYSRWTYQVWCWGLLAIAGIGQWWITYAYFGREGGWLYGSVCLIILLLGSMIYGNRAMQGRSGWNSGVLWLSRHALPLYAIHIVILYLLQQLLM